MKKIGEKLLDGGPYMTYGRPLILKNIPPLFEFGACTNTIVLIWVTLPGLPVDLWNAQVLAKICSKIGEPLWMDDMTGRVEVDIAKELVTDLPIKLPNGKLGEQVIIYENLPKFCSLCQTLGHSTEMCKKKEQVRKQQEGNQLSTQNTLKSMDGDMHRNATVKRDKQASNTTGMISSHDAGLNHDHQEIQLTQVGKRSDEGKGTQLEHTSNKL